MGRWRRTTWWWCSSVTISVSITRSNGISSTSTIRACSTTSTPTAGFLMIPVLHSVRFRTTSTPFANACQMLSRHSKAISSRTLTFSAKGDLLTGLDILPLDLSTRFDIFAKKWINPFYWNIIISGQSSTEATLSLHSFQMISFL